jgi:hypothetical protein
MRFGLVLACLCLAPIARAAPPAEVAKQAKDAFVEGTTQFNLGHWDKAIDSWSRGYELKNDPIFLYNIAQAYRLAENWEKAVFFYKNYLRNAPKAPNRAEVEERIEQLEKLIVAKRNAHDAQPTEPIVANPPPRPQQPPPPPPKPVQPKPQPKQEVAKPAPPPKPQPAPPKPQPQPKQEVAKPQPPPPPPPKQEVVTREPERTTTTVEVRHERPVLRPLRRGDVSISGGVNLWAVGVPGGAQPSTNVALSGGYTAWYNDRLELRVGAKIGYTYLADIGSTEHFLSVLADPILALRLWKNALFFNVELGVGALVLTGVANGSVLLPARAAASGTMAAFELRPAVGVEYRVGSRLGIFLMPALIYSPSPGALATSTLLRFDVSLGASVRL